jgi:hypothetical protein
MQILTVTPRSNEIRVDLVRVGHARLTADVFSDNKYSIKFDPIRADEKLMEIIKSAVKQCRDVNHPIKIDLETGEAQHLQNKAWAPTKSLVEDRQEWQRLQKVGFPITKEKAFDNLNNEGGEGFNPYRDA